MRPGEAVFVDTGAWIALALRRDPLHARAVEGWRSLQDAGARIDTSVSVILETFTFLERNTLRDVALAWKDSLAEIERFHVHDAAASDLEITWRWFERRDLHKLSAVDAMSFAIMEREKIRTAFAFDHHFAMAGFRLVG